MRRHNSAKVLILLPDPCFTTKNCRMSINLRFGGHTLPHIPLVSTEKHPNGRGFRSVGSILRSSLTRLCPFPSTRGLQTRFLPKSAKSFESQPFFGIQVDFRTCLADPLSSPLTSSGFEVPGSPSRSSNVHWTPLLVSPCFLLNLVKDSPSYRYTPEFSIGHQMLPEQAW